MSPSSVQTPPLRLLSEGPAQTFTQPCWKPWGPAPSLDASSPLPCAGGGSGNVSSCLRGCLCPPDLACGVGVTEVTGLLLTSPRSPAPRKLGWGCRAPETPDVAQEVQTRLGGGVSGPSGA